MVSSNWPVEPVLIHAMEHSTYMGVSPHATVPTGSAPCQHFCGVTAYVGMGVTVIL